MDKYQDEKSRLKRGKLQGCFSHLQLGGRGEANNKKKSHIGKKPRPEVFNLAWGGISQYTDQVQMRHFLGAVSSGRTK